MGVGTHNTLYIVQHNIPTLLAPRPACVYHRILSTRKVRNIAIFAVSRIVGSTFAVLSKYYYKFCLQTNLTMLHNKNISQNYKSLKQKPNLLVFRNLATNLKS